MQETILLNKLLNFNIEQIRHSSVDHCMIISRSAPSSLPHSLLQTQLCLPHAKKSTGDENPLALHGKRTDGMACSRRELTAENAVITLLRQVTIGATLKVLNERSHLGDEGKVWGIRIRYRHFNYLPLVRFFIMSLVKGSPRTVSACRVHFVLISHPLLAFVGLLMWMDTTCSPLAVVI